MIPWVCIHSVILMTSPSFTEKGQARESRQGGGEWKNTVQLDSLYRRTPDQAGDWLRAILTLVMQARICPRPVAEPPSGLDLRSFRVHEVGLRGVSIGMAGDGTESVESRM